MSGGPSATTYCIRCNSVTPPGATTCANCGASITARRDSWAPSPTGAAAGETSPRGAGLLRITFALFAPIAAFLCAFERHTRLLQDQFRHNVDHIGLFILLGGGISVLGCIVGLFHGSARARFVSAAGLVVTGIGAAIAVAA